MNKALTCAAALTVASAAYAPDFIEVWPNRLLEFFSSSSAL